MKKNILTINEIFTFLPEKLQGKLPAGMQMSNPIKVEGKDWFLFLILSFNCCCETMFLVKPEFSEGQTLVKYGVLNDTPITIKGISAKMKDNVITVHCKTLNSNDNLEFELFVP